MISLGLGVFAVILAGAAGVGNYAAGLFSDGRRQFWHTMSLGFDLLGMCAVLLAFVAGRLA